MKRLWVAAALAPLSFAASAHAQQTISTGVSTPVTTSGAGGDVTVTGSITPTTGGTASAPVAAVTVNSYNNATNTGSLTFTGLNYTAGIEAVGVTPPASATLLTIENTGTITNNETVSDQDAANGDNITDTNIDNNPNKTPGVYLFAYGSNRFGIQVNGAGQTTAFNGGIINTGTINIIGENSAGIDVEGGGITGSLLNQGTISVTGGNPAISGLSYGNNPGTDVSYGIHVAGPVGGNVTILGTVNVVGKNATAVALQNNVGGPVEVYGALTATGYETASPIPTSSLQSLMQAQAAEQLLQGGPALLISGGTYANGISLDTAVPAFGTTTAVAGATVTSEGSAPAIMIGGTAPITINPLPTTGSVQSAQLGGGFGLTPYGSAALQAGTTAATPGGTGNFGYGLVLGGITTGAGEFPLTLQGNIFVPVNAYGVEINGSGPSALVTINGGVSITGLISAQTVGGQVPNPTTADTPTGDATALFIDNAVINANTTAPASSNANGAINVTGTIAATSETQSAPGVYTQTVGSGTVSTTVVPPTATGILLGPNAKVASINNLGTIGVAIDGIPSNVFAEAGGAQGYATAINDQSGNLTTVNNYSAISAKITPINPAQGADPANSQAIAIDLRHNTSGATVTQDLAATPILALDQITGLTTTVIPTILGDVLFGSGNGVLNLNAGGLSGGLQFGAGLGNQINVNNGAVGLGQLAEASGGSVAISVSSGVLGLSAPVSTLLQSTYDAQNHIEPPTVAVAPATQVAIGVSSITLGATGQLVLSVFAPSATVSNAQVGGPQLDVSGAVDIAPGGSLGVNFLSKLSNSATYNLIESQGPITGANVQSALGDLPFIYQGAIGTTTLSNGDNAVQITIRQKTVAEMDLNPGQAAAFNAFYANFDRTTGNVSGNAIGSVVGTVLSQTTRAEFDHLYNQFLPDYAGGPFETLVMGQDALSAAEADTPAKLQSDGSRGWVQEIGFQEARSSSDVVGYSGQGFGVAGGTETVDGRNAVGVAMALLSTAIDDTGRPAGSSQTASVVEGGLYWRNGGDGLNVGASVNGGWAFLESHRVLLSQSGTDDATFFREAKANWDGAIASADFSLAYKASFGRYFIKPEALAEYVMLYETAYTETGAANSVDLTVNSKLSKEGVVQADMVLGATYGDAVRWTPSVTLGWRQIVTGGPAATTAHYAGGSSFTLQPNFQPDEGGLLARLGLRASGNFADFSANGGGVFRVGYDSVDARATARFLF